MVMIYLFLSCLTIFSFEHSNSYFENAMTECSHILNRINKLTPLPFIDKPSKVLSSKDYDIYFINNLDVLISFPYHLKQLHKIINELGYLTIDERIVVNIYLEKILFTTRYIDKYIQINEIIIKDKVKPEMLDIVSHCRTVTEQILLMTHNVMICNDSKIDLLYFISTREVLYEV